MNQILYTGGKKDGPSSIKSIVRFFSICLILFGLVFAGKGSYALYENHELSKVEVDNTFPTISFDQEGNNAIITAYHKLGISKIKYHWNNDDDEIGQGNSDQTVIIDDIPISPGTNTLYVSAIDVNGKVTEDFYNFSYDGIAIEFSVIDNTYIKITASDVQGLSSLSYKWNSDEEIEAYPDERDLTKIEQLTEIPTGLNTLSVTAVNALNKTLTQTQSIKGNHPPKIEIYKQGNNLVVVVTDEEGIDKIVQQINVDEAQVIDIDGLNEYKYKVPISETDRILIKITAIDVEGVGRTFNGVWN